MGGYGSGQRWSSKATTSEHHQLDVRELQRGGFLVADRTFFCMRWKVEVIANKKRDIPNLLCFYESGIEAARQTKTHTVWIEWQPCNYGGTRAWFTCPNGCGRRVAIVYFGETFGCRHCNDLTYQSQQESHKYRSLHRARSIRMKLGGSGSLAEPLRA